MDLFVYGSLPSVTLGKVSPTYYQKIPTESLAYGLGALATTNPEVVIAESLLFEQVAYAYAPQKVWNESHLLKTPFYMGIKAKPKRHFKQDHEKTLKEIYDELLLEYPKGCVLVASGLFIDAHIKYLKKPPIYGESLREFTADYIVEEHLVQMSGQIFAVILDHVEPRILYEDLNEVKKKKSVSHSHIKIGEKTAHLVVSSKIAAGDFWVEEIDHIHFKE